MRIRAERAFELLAEGWGYRQTVAQLGKEFGISVRTAERDCARAQKLLLEEYAAERPARRAALEARLARLSRAAEEAGAFGAAVRAIAVIGRWAGFDQLQLNPAADPDTEWVLSMTGVDREKRIAELVAKRIEGATEPQAPLEPEPDARRPFDPADRARGRR